MNEFELMIVHEDMRQKGIVNYTVRPGNDCIWVSYGRVNAYYIFREGRLADVQID